MLARCGLAFISVLVLLFPSPVSAAEEKPVPAPDVADVLSISTYPHVSRQVEAAQALLEAREWKKAIAVLQPLLDREDDVLIEVKIKKPEGGTTSRITSARVEAIRMLKSMPEEGRKIYEEMHGKAAWAFLQELGTDRDLLRAYRRFPTTRAGGIALRAASEQVRPSQKNWLLWGGDAGHCLPAPAFLPKLEEKLRIPLVENPVVKTKIEEALTAAGKSGRTILPPGTPIGVTVASPKNGDLLPIVYFITHKGLKAVNVRTLKRHYESPMEWSLERTLSDLRYSYTLSYWFEWYVAKQHRPDVILQNTMTSSATSDSHLVFTLDDFQVPPPIVPFRGWQGDAERIDLDRPRRVVIYGTLLRALRSSTLKAYSTFTGKLRWQVGGPSSGDNKVWNESIFLGPPLPLENCLYVLSQREGDLRLFTLDSATGKLIATQPLGSLRETLLDNPVRRTHAVHLAYGDGVVVCPTNAGVVFGVDVIDGGLRWIYPYQAKKTAPALAQDEAPALAESYWKVTAPMIADGKVVFAAPDSPTIHCVNLRDGTRVWALHQQKDDLYLAGVSGDRVLIAGKTGLRAVSVAKGATLWTAPVGLPSGRGVIGTDGRYYLPVAATAKEKKPGVVAIDIANGTLAAAAIADDGKVPGNLMFFNDLMVSQTVTELTVYSR